MVLPNLSLQSIRKLRRKLRSAKIKIHDGLIALEEYDHWGAGSEHEEIEADRAYNIKRANWLDKLDSWAQAHIRKNHNVAY